MEKVSKDFIRACNRRFAEKEKVYGGKDNPKNYKNMKPLALLMRVLNQESIINRLGSMPSDELRKELVDTANLCELAWRKLR